MTETRDQAFERRIMEGFERQQRVKAQYVHTMLFGHMHKHAAEIRACEDRLRREVAVAHTEESGHA